MSEMSITGTGAYVIIGVIDNMINLFHWHFQFVRKLVALGGLRYR